MKNSLSVSIIILMMLSPAYAWSSPEGIIINIIANTISNVSWQHRHHNHHNHHNRHHKPKYNGYNHEYNYARPKYHRPCHLVFKYGTDAHGYSVRINGIMCYNHYGNPYIVKGTRHLGGYN